MSFKNPTHNIQFEPEYHKEQPLKENNLVMGVVGLEHNHIYSMCQGMKEAGAVIHKVFDEDPKKMKDFQIEFPEVEIVNDVTYMLEDNSLNLIASAAITSERCEIGLQVLDSGKHFFSAKAPFTTVEQLRLAEKKVKETGLRWAVFYSERVQVECANFAEQLINKGAIGKVVQVLGMGPHRLNFKERPDWFFLKKKYGGIICDIGSHQIEQFLWFTGAKDASILSSTAQNNKYPALPDFEDYGDAHLLGDNGSVHYFRIDWFTPDGLNNWGDGRTFILGTDGYIELRKYVDITEQPTGERLYLVNHGGERKYDVSGKVGFPYFYQLANDLVNNTSLAMSQEHIFKAAELSLLAQQQAK